MRIVPRCGGLVASAPAKINLFLELLGKRSDGYHEIATLMVALSLRDTLAFKDDPSGELTLSCTLAGQTHAGENPPGSTPTLSTGPDNLILKAARLLQTTAGVSRGTRIHLRKRIPMGGGLAGGSTDAAATLLALNRLWKIGLSSTELAKLSAQLGSDIPFFFALPAAWCTGRGEIARPAPAPKPLDLVLIFPPFGCDTASVYRNVSLDGTIRAGEPALKSLAEGNVPALSKSLFNRLLAAALRVAPELAKIKTAVERIVPSPCEMSGSGSTLFVLASDRPMAVDFARKIAALPELKDCRVKIVRTLAGPASPLPRPG